MRHHPPRLLSRLALALVLVLAQSLAFAHRQDHVGTADTTVCDTCLVAQGLDLGLTGEVQVAPANLQSGGGDAFDPGSSIPVQHPRRYLTRAPPVPTYA